MPRIPRGRNRNPFNFRPPMGGQAVPPPPVVAANPVIDLNKLNVAYEWMAIDKLVGFKLVIEWYATSQVALLWKDALDADRQKTLSRAQLAVNQGNGTAIDHEKMAAWRTAIRLFEKLWSHKEANWPLVDKIEAAPAAVSAHILNIQTVLTNLNAAFAPAGCRFRPTFNDAQELLHGEILLPQSELFAMIPQTPLAVALGLVPTVAKVLSVVTVDGEQKLDGPLFMKKLPEVLEHVNAWAAAGSVYKPVGKAPVAAKAPKVPGGPKAPRAPRVGAAGPTIGKTQVITLTTTVASMKGHHATIYSLIKTGMRVQDLQAAAAAHYNEAGWKSRSITVLKTLVAKGVITIA